jgi:hypothetical protein
MRGMCYSRVGIVRTAVQALCFFGIVVNPVSIGHFTSLGSPQNGHVTRCGTSFARLNGPETVNVFLHDVQVMIFSIYASPWSVSPLGLESVGHRCECTRGHLRSQLLSFLIPLLDRYFEKGGWIFASSFRGPGLLLGWRYFRLWTRTLASLDCL